MRQEPPYAISKKAIVLFGSVLLLNLLTAGAEANGQASRVRAKDAYITAAMYRVSETPDSIRQKYLTQFLLTAREHQLKIQHQRASSFGTPKIQALTPYHRKELEKAAIVYDKALRSHLAANNHVYEQSKLLKVLSDSLSSAGGMGKKAPTSHLALAVELAKVTGQLSLDYAQDRMNSRAHLKAKSEIAKRSKSDPGAVSTFASAWEIANSKTNPDREFATVLDRMVGHEISASVYDNAETILGKNPKLAELQKLSELEAKAQSGIDVSKEIKASLAHLAKHIQNENAQLQAENRARAEMQMNESTRAARRELETHLFDIWSRNVITVAQLAKVDPKVVNTLVTVTEATKLIKVGQQLIQDHAGTDLAGMAASAAMGNYLQAGLMVAGLFAKQGPSADQVILEQIQLLRQELYEFREMVADSFHNLNLTLAQNHLIVMEQFENLAESHRVSHALMRDLQGQIEANSRQLVSFQKNTLSREYRKRMENCLPSLYGENGNSGQMRTVNATVLIGCTDAIVNLASYSASEISESKGETSSASMQTRAHIDIFDNLRDIGMLIQSLAHNAGLLRTRVDLSEYTIGPIENSLWRSSQEPFPLSDLATYKVAIRDFVILIDQHSVSSSAQTAADLSRIGTNIKNYLSDLFTVSTDEKPAATRVLQTEFFEHLVRSYTSKINELAVETDILADRMTGPLYQIHLGAKQNLTEDSKRLDRPALKIPMDTNPLQLCNGAREVPFKKVPAARYQGMKWSNLLSDQEHANFAKFATEKDGGIKAQINPDHLKKYIPNFYKVGLASGFGQLRVCIDANLPALSITHEEIHDTTIRVPTPIMMHTDGPIDGGVAIYRMYFWRAKLAAKLRLQFVIPGDERRGIPEVVHPIGDIEVSGESVNSHHKYHPRVAALSEIWNQKIAPQLATEKAGPSIRLVREAQQRSYLLALADFFASRRQEVINKAMGDSRGLYAEANKLYQVLREGLELSVGPQSYAKNFGFVHDKDLGLLSPIAVMETILSDAKVNNRILAADLNRREESVLKQTRALERVPLELSHPLIDGELEVLKMYIRPSELKRASR